MPTATSSASPSTRMIEFSLRVHGSATAFYNRRGNPRAQRLSREIYIEVAMPFASSDRGSGRPVKRRTRTFRPNYLSFAGTYQCNLTCPHCCVPIEWPDYLDIDVALHFLEDARNYGIEVLGFTGGDPFLYPEFLLKLTR